MSDDAAIRVETDRAVASFEWAAIESVQTLVVDVVAEFADESPAELEPLYVHVDPDALGTLFEPIEDGPTRTDGTAEFPFDDYRVTVHADGRVVVTPGRAGAGQ